MSALSKSLIFPKSFLSFFVGLLARMYIPGVSKIINYLFIKVFSIEMSEAEHPASHYKTVEDVFTRALKPGERAIGEQPVSPADGMLSVSMGVSDGMAVQAKGINYSVSELVFGSESPREGFDPVWFTTVYLAPHNYHRVHTPVSGQIISMKYIPGELWPVNRPAVSYVPKLFCRNERLVFSIKTEAGIVHAVMVGALNVARMISKHWPDLTTHDSIKVFTGKSIEKSGLSIPINAGDELGIFMLGSTVVLVYEKGSIEVGSLLEVNEPQKITMGTSLKA